MSAAATILYVWFTHHSFAMALLQSNTALGALLGAHLGLLLAYLRSYQDEAPASWEVIQRDRVGIIMAVLLLIYAVGWIAVSL
ncbi:hypothetical protein K2Z83_27890 [Oscillochloris sp. ZM17-4]|uniref:hypothetical protein n=1 Tax=Oscillochloris sp. ZM17-4 TaxID=2866714 RepID=UPI001C732532|nr:hypothetical protein [Oscillochloris sp. ZM17-4]MBX0331479.1 hypothetical protein [Oscillochloris sp. ZM17-4]